METTERFQLDDTDLMRLFKREERCKRDLPIATDAENIVIAATYWGLANG